MNIEFSRNLPAEEGQYLIKWNFLERLDLITVVRKPACTKFGIDWPECLVIP